MVTAIPAADLDSDRPRRGLVRAVIAAARLKQWVKNLLVFAAPGAAGVLSHAGAAERAVGAVAIFCTAASGVYMLNDAIDSDADRLHPLKARRPIAAGDLSAPLAVVFAIVLLGSSLVASGLAYDWQFATVIAVYVAINLAYSLGLKREPVLDLVAVASGFVLRAIAGGVATQVPLSNWFLIVASFGSLFIVAGKRHAEHMDLGEARASHRATLMVYSLSYLRFVRSTAAGITLLAYCLWAFEKADHAATSAIFYRLSIVPIAVGVLRYALLLDQGEGGAPEDLVIEDRRLQLTGLVWIVLFALGVYVR